MRPYLLAAFILILTIAPGRARTSGAIYVSVSDQNNKPVKTATVTARPDCFPSADFLPSCVTNSDGKCIIPATGPCTFFLSASKHADGYLDANQFNCGEHCKRTPVTLAEKDSTASVTVPLTNKGVFLKVEVIDAVTGKQIPLVYVDEKTPMVYFEFLWANDGIPGMQTPTDENGMILLPAEIPLKLKVSRNGYRDWTYTSPSDPSNHVLLLHFREKRVLHIRLQPNP